MSVTGTRMKSTRCTSSTRKPPAWWKLSSIAAAAAAGALCGDGVGPRFELVLERGELDLLAGRVDEGVGEQAVGEPRVAREQGAVEVGAVDAAPAAALVAGLAVVAEARHHAPERLGALVEVR